MKLTIDRTALLKCLTHVQSVVERRNTIPILSNVLISAGDGHIGLTATDMDIDIVERAVASVEVPGSTTAPAHTLYDIVRKLPDGSEVELDGGGDKERVRVRAGRSTFTLPALPVADFPAISGDSLPHSFELTATELKRLIDRTKFAISTEETRYYLNGIYVHATRMDDRPVLRAVATDGHRLARVEQECPDGATGMPGVIVPRKTVQELRKLLDEVDQPVAISLSETRIRFAFGAVVLTSKLIDGTFPDYERVIPTGNDKVMEVSVKPFSAAVDRVATISTEKSRAVKLAVQRGTLTLSATSPDAGSATEELEAVYTGPSIEIGFNSRYLLDITQQIEGDEAKFMMADAAAPTVIYDAADPEAVFVLMPMRV
ncbi:MAG: DNA polymerase III subunit beta [Alphaproteobacteria bacterium]|nr:DNA polymerase III subunit beta [Alphaproteobacteria bacterium]TAD90887.1 MAG: DNA polymerase III subunit beta [Alphaproteobacteria bacterium]